MSGGSICVDVLSDFLEVKSTRDAAKLIDQKLSEVPPGVLAEGEWILSIPPLGENGFSIDLSKSCSKILCLFGELEQKFDRVLQAMVWIERALSDAYQLWITSSGGRPTECRTGAVIFHDIGAVSSPPAKTGVCPCP